MSWFRCAVWDCLLTTFLGLCIAAPTLAADAPLPETVEFNRDVRPILSDACFHCHGPDKSKRQADLHFDTEDGATADLGDGRKAIVPGRPDASELIARVISDVPEQRMPPPEAERQLTPRQVAILKKWIEQGAKWQKHWAYIAPRRPALPEVKNTAWPRTSLDRFILARLESEGLAPSSETGKATLLRRVTLDLTGLPPTLEEIEAFLSDNSPDAYEKVVDRLLASPRYGERMAVRWLDGARYADTSGYQSDGDRVMWRWRDWVIDAYNANKPFDEFTVEQLAGDLLPGATLDQKLATGFNRNHRGNGEGGIIPEEYAVEYVVDRVETTSTVWLGTTMMCVRCHSHKYDPFEHRDFYRLYAFFNSIPEKGRAVKYGNSPPYITTPTDAQQMELARLDAELAAAERSWISRQPEIRAALTTWSTSSAAAKAPADWSLQRSLTAHYSFDGTPAATFLSPSASAPPASYLSQMRNPEPEAEAVKEKFQETGKPRFAVGRFGQALDCDDTHYAAAGNVANFGFFDKFSFAFWIRPSGDHGGTVLSRMVDVHHGNGWSVLVEKGKLQVHLSQRFLDDACRSEAAVPIRPDEWQHVVVSYDGSRDAAGIRFHIDGEPVKTVVLLDELNQTFATKEPLRIGAGNGPQGRFHGLIDDVRIFDRVLNDDEARIVALTDPLPAIAATAPEKRTASQSAKLSRFFLEHAAPESIRAEWNRLLSLRAERTSYFDSLPNTMVMEELPEPRRTHLLLRGEYDKPGEEVARGVPSALSPWPKDAPKNRLGLAQWIISRDNPLTARVAVNRLWQQFFGTGLVKTVDDFGIQGEWPSHPELLDWLATEFQGSGVGGQWPGAGQSTSPPAPSGGIFPSPAWDTKRLLREIVTSATYRQSSKATAALVQRDPDNRLLARGPRFRLSAEMIRDQALAASGLLVERIGGPSVKPYQPEGLYKDLAGADYDQGHGDDLYRRSLYTYWKRTIAPPFMMTFDAAGRETCIVKETRTNTPLQALNLMNDVTYVEAARVMAEQLLGEKELTQTQRIRTAFRRVTGREPTALEIDILSVGLERHRKHFSSDAPAAIQLIGLGEWPRNSKLDVTELAAYSTLIAMIQNLDEAVTRE